MNQTPYSGDAERALLGSILLQPAETLDLCSGKITDAHFYVPSNQLIYQTLRSMADRGKLIDLVTLTQRLIDDNNLESVGGAAEVASMFNMVPSHTAADYYIDIIRRKYIRRQMMRVGKNLLTAAFEKQDVEESSLLDEAQAEITTLSREATGLPELRHISEGVDEALRKLEVAYLHRGTEAPLTGVSTGIYDFDRMTGGLKPQQLIIIAARPSHGKTALAMNWAHHMALGNPEKRVVPISVAIFSMEMSYQEICDRLTCSAMDVSVQRLRDGLMDKQTGQAIVHSLPAKAVELKSSRMYIDDTRGLRITDFKGRARRAVVELNVGCIFVDYLQLMEPARKSKDPNRVQEITEITAGLKSMAKELNLPIVVCAQLNREAEKRAFGEPKISDLRESGSIEQDADIVALLWRPIRHCADTADAREACAKRLDMPAQDLETFAQLKIAKQRNGPVDPPIKLRFQDDLTKFTGVTKQQWTNKLEERQK